MAPEAFGRGRRVEGKSEMTFDVLSSRVITGNHVFNLDYVSV